MNPSRRAFISKTVAGTLGFTLLPSSVIFANEKQPIVKLGFIGVGLRGQDHLELALRRSDVQVFAICDVQQHMIDKSLQLISKAGKPKPQVIIEGDYGYRKMLENKDIDAVIVATPWEWHTVMCLDAMNAKKIRRM